MLPFPYLKKQTAVHNVFAAEDSRFISIDFETAKDIINRSDRANTILIRILQEEFKFQLKLRHLRELPAMEKISEFFKEYGNLSNKLSNTEIAAFLDMSRAEYVRIFKTIDLTNL